MVKKYKLSKELLLAQTRAWFREAEREVRAYNKIMERFFKTKDEG
jgi:hypothetical protein